MKTSCKVRPIEQSIITFGIVGISPLIHHAWSEKGKKQMRMSALERRKQQKVARDPERESAEGAYLLENGDPAFPLLAFKAALISAAHKDYGLEKTTLRKGFFLAGDPPCLTELNTPDGHVIREDIVRLNGKTTDLRYRREYPNWSVIISAYIDTSLLNAEDIVNLTNRAGFGVGVGEWRPENDGEYGRFKIDTTVPFESQQIEI